MRWELKPEPPAPKHGDIRQKFRFAWVPTKIGLTKVWLENYVEESTYNEVYSYHAGIIGSWIVTDLKLKESASSEIHLARWYQFGR